ncbi:sugar transporter [Truncatella angustata]|uniref:Sugar transporter n=1 Tax=Truncatella angustata TaxID=152316 RepID=A0A9P8UE16_9PEZI|nr:sugar transporter [Truncatella angustata]KAH6648201.1 sugar transporter [Truncatella angustata]KAH8201958.1 hypothetical protein TruAng_003871 [Truncatella angustata]
MASPDGFFQNRRVYLLTAVAYMGALLFGFDTGVMGSVLAMDSFKLDFGLPLESSGFASEKNANVSSNVVALLTAGAFFGAIAASIINDMIGRRATLFLFCTIFMVGAAIQTGATHAISLIYAGRIIAGLGVGGLSGVMSVYVSENAPPKIRGRIAGLFQEMLVIGSTFAYWLDYGVAKHIPTGTKQWRIPVAIQLIPGGLMLVGLCFLKESPRWLAKKGRNEKAHESLAHVRCRGMEDPLILAEMAEIRAAVEEEHLEMEGFSWKEIFAPANRKRFVLAFFVMFWQQFSGTNSIGYYAPQIFQTIGISSSDSSLFATGVYGTVKVVATAIFLLIGIDKWGRKWSLVGGAVWMTIMMLIIGILLVKFPPNPNADGVSSASIAMAVMIYLYVIGYSASWGPTPWVFVSEIFPTRLRAYGVGVAAATQWAFNFVITKITPIAIASIGWKTFIMFAVFCFAMGLFVLLFVPETKQRTLEEIDIIFGAVDAETRRHDVEKTLDAKKKEANMAEEERIE